MTDISLSRYNLVMKKSWINGVLTLLIISVYLILPVFGPEGSLLCFGKDGHVAIEFIDACNASGFSSQLAGMEESDACGPCTDVELQSSPARLNHESSSLTLHGQPLSFQSVAAVPSANFIRETQTRSSIPFQKSLTSLNSVVLRI